MNKLLMISLFVMPFAANAQVVQSVAPSDSAYGAPSATAYQGGIGSPSSNRASNIEGSGVHAEIAPRLPSPVANSDDAHAFLVAANQALLRNQTGVAQEALERAETRILTRSTDPTDANQPDTRLIARAVADARLALGQNDARRAQVIIERVLNPS